MAQSTHRNQAPPTHLLHEGSELLVRVVVIHADPTLDRYRRAFPGPIPHRQTQVLYQRGRSHERRSEGSLARDLVAGAAAVEVDCVVVVRTSQAAGLSDVGGVRTADLRRKQGNKEKRKRQDEALRQREGHRMRERGKGGLLFSLVHLTHQHAQVSCHSFDYFAAAAIESR